jgi:hypothetical protein
MGGPRAGTDVAQVELPGGAGPLMPTLSTVSKSMLRFAAPCAQRIREFPQHEGTGVSRIQAGFVSRSW